MTSKALLVLAALAAALMGGTAHGAAVPERTLTMSASASGGPADGRSTRPSLSFDGLRLAFESAATNLAPDGNGAMVDIFERDLVAGTTRLVSEGFDGRPADGPSGNPSLGGKVIAFYSEATNLVPGDDNGLRDVFIRSGTGPVVRVSEAPDGTDANGASSEPDISNDGRFVVFTSAASNLVPDDRNGQTDVFLRDTATGRISRVSEAGDDSSRAPSISSTGRYVSFYSLADDLVPGDTNRKGDVFVADMQSGLIQLVSVGRRGQQNRTVISPFSQISDVSRDGRYVVFDSDATNLVRRDRNRDTDVFVRDRKRERTTRISINASGREGNNDSFFPTMSSDGRYVAFQSFAENLAPGDGPREDVFVFDRARRLPSVMTVGSRGERRAGEAVGQLLQRPSISGDGQLVSFTSTADNLTSDDADGIEDVFLRVASPPAILSVDRPRRIEPRRRPRLRVEVDDSRATVLACQVDGRRVPCRNGQRLRRLEPGRHVLRVRAGGPGMLYQSTPVVRRFVIRR